MNRAFTMIELMITIAIISVIAAIAIPNLTESRRTQQAKAQQSNPAVINRFESSGNTYNVVKITIEGHTYMFIECNTRHGWNVVHDPACICSKPLKPLQVEKAE